MSVVLKMSCLVPRASSRGALMPFGFRNIVSPKCPILRISANYASASNDAILPHLPVPALDVTIKKYLKSIKPHLTPQEFVISTNVISEFASKGGIGEKLQALLEKRATAKENWLADWWLHSAYLDFRWPVVVYSNPGLVFPYQTFNSKSDRLMYAAKLIIGALEYKDVVDNDKLPVDKMGKEPLDMQQYKKIFGTCRIPGAKRDTLTFNNSNHIIVIHNNHFFKLPIVGKDGVSLNEEQLAKLLNDIVNASQQKTSDAVGVLTSEHRDTWAKLYEQMAQDPSNRAHFQTIKESLFVMCLDAAAGKKQMSREEKQVTGAGHTIHGGGSKLNSGNRWFDKTIQLIVGEDGLNGLTYEHSPAEGQPVAILTDRVVEYANNTKGQIKSPGSSSLPTFDRLEFNVTKDIRDAIAKANENVDKLAADLELNCFSFGMFGKEFIKSQKLSPDSFIQMAMQFAFYRLHGTPGAHYESAATRKYIGGRTETIRSCSEESIAFAKIMLDSNANLKDKANALKMAIKAHKDYSVEAVNGFGVDRHLLGLKLTATENGIEIPKIYSDSGFVKSSHMRMSTSQVASKFDGFMCYGPLVPDGYAICYNPRANDINFAAAAFNACPETSAAKYRNALENSLVDMHNVLLQSTQSKL
ncbi:carnitine O-Acetyl-Transferase [Arctopsyche grandis]|uniref:carnitine O-Acetyl-Transferase n=1 Tax=Arctopsyche grandis TaxID=121162 RepID=UPI00406D70C6